MRGMSRESFVFVIGLLVFLVSFLGVPQDWKKIFFIAAGVMLMIVGFMLRRAAFVRSIEKENGERESDVFAESFEPELTVEDVFEDDEFKSTVA